VHDEIRRQFPGTPYVIENVAGAKKELEELGLPVVKLNGFMFPDDLRVDWPPPDQAQRIASESREEGEGRHWNKCRCDESRDGKKHPAYYCYVQDKMPTEWTIRRDRYFAVNGFSIIPPEERQEKGREVMSVTVSPNPTMVWNKINRQSVPLKVRQEVMGGLGWMTARGVGECIPPPYTREIARQFLRSQ
jgi:hypothetical protein